MSIEDDAVAELEAAEAKEEKASGSRLSPAQWEEIAHHWQWETKSATEMSREYGISGSAISLYFKRHGIVKGSKKRAKEEEEKRILAPAPPPAAPKFADKRDQLIEDTKMQSYATATLINIAIHNIITSQQKAGKAVSDRTADIKALRFAAATVRSTQEIRYKVLDIDSHIDTDDLPELHLRELTKEEVEGIRNRVDEAMDEYSLDMDVPKGPNDDEVIETGMEDDG